VGRSERGPPGSLSTHLAWSRPLCVLLVVSGPGSFGAPALSLGYRPSFSRTLRLASTAAASTAPYARVLEGASAVLRLLISLPRRDVLKPGGQILLYYPLSPLTGYEYQI
jgi:hypothetical protein